MADTPCDLLIRPARPEDCAAIAAIYNHYVVHGTATYHIVPETPEQRQAWLAGRGPQHPTIVASCGGVVAGFGALSPLRAHEAYAHTVENSVYVDPAWHRRGLGRALMAELIRVARELDHHTIVAVIDAAQTSSLRFHAALGFVEVGRLREVGRKFDRWLDVVYMQLLLKTGPVEVPPGGL
jgi:L-amino acid N-acyltransferase YncA